MKKEILKNKKGFTLIELLLYVGVTSFILTAVVSFTSVLLQIQAKNKTVAEVEQQGAEVVQVISQAIRNSNGINSPSSGASATSLSIGMDDASKNPTIFSVNTGVLQVSEGANTYYLTNSKVTMVNLSFSNLSRDGTPGVVKFSFTLSYVNNDERSEFNYDKTFQASASLR
ncbi:MAG: type II secretion system protein [Candidatus Magasanikbacteria bacterium]|nr:type II secretion system protein [Candidatus Magasanikbacteria bacterium]